MIKFDAYKSDRMDRRVARLRVSPARVERHASPREYFIRLTSREYSALRNCDLFVSPDAVYNNVILAPYPGGRGVLSFSI